MPTIRPISDLRNKFSEISQIVHEQKEPVFLTKNGCGNMVVMSIDEYERREFMREIDQKLFAAQQQAMSDTTRYTHDEVFSKLRASLNEKKI